MHQIVSLKNNLSFFIVMVFYAFENDAHARFLVALWTDVTRVLSRMAPTASIFLVDGLNGCVFCVAFIKGQGIRTVEELQSLL